MANQFGIDLGSVYRTAEAIKTSRYQRGANEAAATNALATQDAANRFAAGDNSAFPELVSLDPKMAKDVIEAFTALDDAGKKAKRDEIDQLGQIAAGILSAPDPAAAYAKVLAALPPEEAAKFPPTFDPNFVQAQLARATEIDTLYDSIKEDKKYNRDRADKATDTAVTQENALALEDRRTANDIKIEGVKAENKLADGGAGLESADSSLIFRQAAELLGGVFDQAGNLQSLDPDTRAKAQEIATRASTYFIDGMTHAEAVKKAAQELGITFPGSAPAANVMAAPAGAGAPAPAAGNPDDPLGLF